MLTHFQRTVLVVRKKKIQYFLRMREISNIGNIDYKSLMHYVMQILGDAPRKKAILFGITKLAQFKHKILIYDEICQSTRAS